jgi:hypothetical protein
MPQEWIFPISLLVLILIIGGCMYGQHRLDQQAKKKLKSRQQEWDDKSGYQELPREYDWLKRRK